MHDFLDRSHRSGRQTVVDRTSGRLTSCTKAVFRALQEVAHAYAEAHDCGTAFCRVLCHPEGAFTQQRGTLCAQNNSWLSDIGQ